MKWLYLSLVFAAAVVGSILIAADQVLWGFTSVAAAVVMSVVFDRLKLLPK